MNKHLGENLRTENSAARRRNDGRRCQQNRRGNHAQKPHDRIRAKRSLLPIIIGDAAFLKKRRVIEIKFDFVETTENFSHRFPNQPPFMI